VRECYLALAEAEPERFVVVDASRDKESVRASIESIVEDII